MIAPRRNDNAAATSPPFDLDAEKSVIGSILLKPDVLKSLSSIIGPNDFYDTAHAAVYLAACDCWEAGEPVDAVTVGQRLEAAGRLADVGGAAGINDFMEAVGNVEYIDHYAGIVAEKSRRRRMYYDAHDLARKAADPSTDAE